MQNNKDIFGIDNFDEAYQREKHALSFHEQKIIGRITPIVETKLREKTEADDAYQRHLQERQEYENRFIQRFFGDPNLLVDKNKQQESIPETSQTTIQQQEKINILATTRQNLTILATNIKEKTNKLSNDVSELGKELSINVGNSTRKIGLKAQQKGLTLAIELLALKRAAQSGLTNAGNYIGEGLTNTSNSIVEFAGETKEGFINWRDQEAIPLYNNAIASVKEDLETLDEKYLDLGLSYYGFMANKVSPAVENIPSKTRKGLGVIADGFRAFGRGVVNVATASVNFASKATNVIARELRETGEDFKEAMKLFTFIKDDIALGLREGAIEIRLNLEEDLIHLGLGGLIAKNSIKNKLLSTRKSIGEFARNTKTGVIEWKDNTLVPAIQNGITATTNGINRSKNTTLAYATNTKNGITDWKDNTFIPAITNGATATANGFAKAKNTIGAYSLQTKNGFATAGNFMLNKLAGIPGKVDNTIVSIGNGFKTIGDGFAYTGYLIASSLKRAKEGLAKWKEEKAYPALNNASESLTIKGQNSAKGLTMFGSLLASIPAKFVNWTTPALNNAFEGLKEGKDKFATSITNLVENTRVQCSNVLSGPELVTAYAGINNNQNNNSHKFGMLGEVFGDIKEDFLNGLSVINERDIKPLLESRKKTSPKPTTPKQVKPKIEKVEKQTQTQVEEKQGFFRKLFKKFDINGLKNKAKEFFSSLFGKKEQTIEYIDADYKILETQDAQTQNTQTTKSSEDKKDISTSNGMNESTEKTQENKLKTTQNTFIKDILTPLIANRKTVQEAPKSKSVLDTILFVKNRANNIIGGFFKQRKIAQAFETLNNNGLGVYEVSKGKISLFVGDKNKAKEFFAQLTGGQTSLNTRKKILIGNDYITYMKDGKIFIEYVSEKEKNKIKKD